MKSKKKKPNMKKLHENCDAMEACLYHILNYPPEGRPQRDDDDGYPSEVAYDKFAYKRLVDTYRRVAKVGLGIKL